SGEVRIGSYDVLMAGFVSVVIDELARKHRKMIFYTIQGDYSVLRAALRDRKVDAILARRTETTVEMGLITENLFHDPLVVVAGPRSRWVGRRKIRLSELVDERWILPEPDSSIGVLMSKALRANGLELPQLTVMSNSIPLRNRLLATGRYLSVMP